MSSGHPQLLFRVTSSRPWFGPAGTPRDAFHSYSKPLQEQTVRHQLGKESGTHSQTHSQFSWVALSKRLALSEPQSPPLRAEKEIILPARQGCWRQLIWSFNAPSYMQAQGLDRGSQTFSTQGNFGASGTFS